MSSENLLSAAQLSLSRETMRQMLEADRKWREQQATIDRAWKERDQKERAAEAEKVERRHKENSKDAERRFWIGFCFAMLVALASQMASVLIQRQWPVPPAPAPIINVVGLPAHGAAIDREVMGTPDAGPD